MWQVVNQKIIHISLQLRGKKKKKQEAYPSAEWLVQTVEGIRIHPLIVHTCGNPDHLNKISQNIRQGN